MAEKLGVALVLTSFIATTAMADVLNPSAIATLPQPQWTELTVEQKVVLAPLSDEWDAMDYARQKKWLSITRRFAMMTPDEQRRVQAQMQEWGKLTPEQRRLARENFVSASKLPMEKKQELRQKWQEYSSLPEEEKEKLKQQTASKPVPRPGWAPKSDASGALPAPAPGTPQATAQVASGAAPPPSAPASAEADNKR